MRFSVRFYYDADGNKPVLAGIKKHGMGERPGPPLTQLVDQKYDIFELRIGDKNIARVLFFFRQGREIILTNGYVKKQQKGDTGELERARTYKRDWEQRQT